MFVYDIYFVYQCQNKHMNSIYILFLKRCMMEMSYNFPIINTHCIDLRGQRKIIGLSVTCGDMSSFPAALLPVTTRSDVESQDKGRKLVCV